MANQENKQTVNKVEITGVLVKNGLEVRNAGEEKECISGALVLRTDDGSEFEVNYYTNKYKKDQDGKFTNEISKLYDSYETIMTDYVSLEVDKDNADVIKVGICEFSANDFKSQKDNTVVSTNKLRAKFANRLNETEKEITPRVAKFEVSGIVTKMQPEIVKDVATGKGLVYVDIISYGGTIVPVKLTIPSELVEAFGSAGFYETGVAKFTGKLVNTTVVETIVEKQSFGEDNVKEVTTTQKHYEVRGGSPIGDLTSVGITQEQYSTMQSKRRLKLAEILNGTTGTSTTTSQSSNPFGGGSQAQQTSNPFANSNPFAAK